MYDKKRIFEIVHGNVKPNMVKECFKCHGTGHNMTKKTILRMNEDIKHRVNMIIADKHREVSYAERMRITRRVSEDIEKEYKKRYMCNLCKGDGILVYPA